MSCGKASLDYLDRGFSVLPLLPRDKRPHVELLRATYGDASWARLTEEPASPRDAEGWFARCPDANVGIVVGPVSDNLVVVDNDREPEGHLPRTPTARGHRGPHLYLRARAPVANRDGCWGEVRAQRRYVVAPPSIHPTGTPYVWEVPLDDTELLDVDDVDVARLVSDLETTTTTTGSTATANTLPDCLVAPSRDARDLAFDEEAVRAIAELLGAPPTLGRPFRCVIPGHEESHPSASIWAPNGGPYQYRDFHGPSRGDPEWLSLAVVRAAQACGRLESLSGPAASRWWLRLGFEIGAVQPEPVGLPRVPPGEGEHVLRVAEGFRLLWGLRAIRDGTDEPVPFSVRFAAAWCDVSLREAQSAIKRLLALEILSPRGTYGRHGNGRLLGPGSGRPWRRGR